METGEGGKKPAGEPWFAVRRELSPQRATLLTVFSFALPLLVWCAFSYLPFLWHPDVRLEISADRENVTTVYVAGDRVSREFFPEFQEAVRAGNREIEGGLVSFDPEVDPPNGSSVRRANKKVLRHLAPVLVANGWLTEEQTKDDGAIYDAWRDIATGARIPDSPDLDDENLAIVSKNWSAMSRVSPTYDSDRFISVPLLSLVPQGRSSNPDYLPAPHEVVVTGFRDFTAPAEAERPSMWERVGHSVRIVFGGFALAMLVGVPLGVLCGTYPVFSKLLEPFTDFFRYMPAPTFSTLLVAIFLANDAPKIALVFVGTIFQLVLVVANTTRGLDLPLLEAAQTLGAKQRQLLTSVVIPGILPNLYNDLRILLGWAWTWLVIAELVGVKSGLTEFIETQGRWRNFDSVYPVIILIGMIGFFTDQVLAVLRRFLFPWTSEAAAKANPIIRAIFFLPNLLRRAAADRLPYEAPRTRQAEKA
ncbi:MAG: ABC transporter permease [Verrucomicrobiae bacterium]|nr:ABC transporter permease [Verrucomicrobiae bacterium]